MLSFKQVMLGILVAILELSKVKFALTSTLAKEISKSTYRRTVYFERPRESDPLWAELKTGD